MALWRSLPDWDGVHPRQIGAGQHNRPLGENFRTAGRSLADAPGRRLEITRAARGSLPAALSALALVVLLVPTIRAPVAFAGDVPPPPNDNFQSATLISGESGWSAGYSVSATKEDGEPDHAGQPGGASIWYTWTAASTHAYTFDTSTTGTYPFASSDYNTVIAVYVGTHVDSLIPVASNDDPLCLYIGYECQEQAGVVSLQAAAGTTYAIAVDGVSGATGNVVLSWAPTPLADSFPGLTLDPFTNGTIDGTTIGATSEPEESWSFRRSWRSLWYTWTAPYSGPLFLRATSYQSYLDRVDVYIGDNLATLSYVGMVESAGTIVVQSDTTYHFLLTSKSRLPSPWTRIYLGNDDISNAITLSGNGGAISFSNVGATKQVGEPNHAGQMGGASVWYKWTAPLTARYSFSTAGSDFDSLLAVYRVEPASGAWNELVAVASGDDIPGALTSRALINAGNGIEYRIAVDGKAAPGTGLLSWDVTAQLPLQVRIIGEGSVAVDESGHCTANCTSAFDVNTVVTLTASADRSATFSGWSGACSGTGTCEVTMDAAKSLTSTFIRKAPALTVARSGDGTGTVSSSPAGIDCGSTCLANYDYDASVTLTATPGASSTFTGWSGSGCSGTGTCQITMDQARSVDAAFDDITPPDTSLVSGPAGPTASTSASFTFSSEAGASFACSIDSGAFAACTSPKSYTGLAQGSHSFAVRATDPAGNTDASPAIRTWTVDTVAPPAPSISTHPADPTNTTTATFAFADTEGRVTFSCSIDGGGFSACTSGKSYTALTEGQHTFRVKAADVATNESSLTQFTWTVDVTPPQTSLDSGPAGQVSSTSASFTFSSEAGATFACSLDGGAFAACTSPRSYTGLAQGSHTFAVRATDPAGNTDASPAIRTWTVDTVAPETTITAGPAGTVASRTATFRFASSERRSTFACSLDGKAFRTCTSPRTYTGLKLGQHVFKVKAWDRSGNTDRTPAVRKWTVK